MNVKMLLKMEKTFPGIFAKTMINFRNARNFRESLDKTGKIKKIPWEEALKTFYYAKGNRFIGAKDNDRDIAELFEEKNLSQTSFNEAISLREKAKEKGISEHILGRPIREKSIMEMIEEIKHMTSKELEKGNELIQEAFNKNFTYEWLSKNDAHNSIIGLFTGSCATITEADCYGVDIAKAGVIANDVQNLVVKDRTGNIIAKGTLYLNREKGYGVINEFDMDEKYKKSEDKEDRGRYHINPESYQEQEREQIFRAFQRGIQAFAEEYDRQNPTNPLKQINVGMGYNRLKRQVERFKKATRNLSVPIEYNFEDAEFEQYILYARKEKEERGEER